MFDHFTAVQLEQYHERALPLSESRIVSRHLAACASCREHLARMCGLPKGSTPIEIDWSSVEEPGHLNFDEQIASYIDGQLDEVDREIVESHLELCVECTRDVEELREFKDQLEARPAVSGMPLPARPQPPLWTRLFAFRSWLARWQTVHAAGFAVASVLIVVALLIAWQASRTNPPEQLAQTQNANSSPINLSSSISDEQIDSSQAQLPSDANNSSDGSATATNFRVENRNPDQPTSSAAQQSPSPRIVATLNDGEGRVALDERGNLEGLASLSADEQRSVIAALRTQSIQRPSVLANIISHPGVTLKGPEDEAEFALLSPVGTVVLNDRPTFRWQPVRGATSYTVTVVDSALNPVATSESLTATEWTPSRPLPRGMVFRWQVTAIVDGSEVIAPRPPAGEARFRILERDRARRLERARETLARSPLTLGVLYAQEGLADEAEREFQLLIEANPRSTVARRLLHSVRLWRNANAQR